MQKNINDTYSLLFSLFSFFLFFPPIRLYIYSIKTVLPLLGKRTGGGAWGARF